MRADGAGRRKKGLLRGVLSAAVLVVSAAWVGAHVRLIYSGNGNTLYWSNPSSISVVLNEDGSDDLATRTHIPALRNAIDAWNAVTGSQAKLVENTNPSDQASRNWPSSAYHMMLFDEDNSSGFFPPGSGIVAVTPLTFQTNGKIIDADVLFNGSGFMFTTTGTNGRYDIQDVATHELGHLLGLDHSGSAGASMYPYVDPKVILHRSLSDDDSRGLESMYPSSSRGSLSGTVRRSSEGTVVKGAWVGARDAQGRLAGAALSRGNGTFTISALPAGTYSAYATPLDYPVSASNLTEGWAIETDFESTLLAPAAVGASGDTNVGDLLVGNNVAISLGRAADDYPLRVTTGKTTSLMVRGWALANGSTLTASDPTLTLSNVRWYGSSVRFDVSAPAGSAAGHVDLTATRSTGRKSILSGALEVTPPDPELTLVTPSSGSSAGGTALSLFGTGFNPGARVVVGDQVYVDGQPGGCVVVNSTSITLTTRGSIPGLLDVTVIDSTGVEGRSLGAFQAVANPIINSVFPLAGTSAGGTTLTITGNDFVAGAMVSINGVIQPQTTVLGLNQISVLTEVGVPGGPYALLVTNPGGENASASYSYASKADPLLQSVSPDQVDSGGGEQVTLTGENFTSQTQVLFGVDPLKGTGGTVATVTFVDSTTLKVNAPAGSPGLVSLMTRETDTQQACILPGAFTYTGSSGGGGGGGGGCGMIAPGQPTTWRGLMGGAGWILFLVLVFGFRSRNRRLQTA